MPTTESTVFGAVLVRPGEETGGGTDVCAVARAVHLVQTGARGGRRSCS